jgi:hypothetical protein
MLAYPIGLHLEVRQTRWGVVGPALLIPSGVGLVLAGVFPAVDASGNLSYDRLGHGGLIHGLPRRWVRAHRDVAAAGG